ncbi:hypothetical protein MVES1_003766 [Malassezia vespertilionis]|uniref:chitin deacetylase n=1 Tax=Malassezia vespertilionis TaxID=2020962 RepID=A0A2N1J8N8_9BASI|nr:uncharacterized protein MVES1_003766 [Malassezia vespertilionis]PKI82904.1 hypothetical protein MVES_003325 [Malassezia vespertilionis]WFD08394.1 hypothetical protein MVES1_003766 [Malassezia vespertilionis]
MKLSGFTLCSLLAVSAVSASVLHLVPGNDDAHEHLVKRHGFVRRQAAQSGPTASNEADFAKIKDPKQQCAVYGVPEITQMQDQGVIPTGGEPATIQQKDAEAQKIWKDIQDSGIIPNDVQVKKQQGSEPHMGIDSSSYNAQEDPDCWWSASTCKTPKHKNPGMMEDLYTCPEPDTWGLTFDDGPNCSHNAFYDFLAENKLRATLFYIGTNVLNHPYQAQRGIADGHDICVHTWSHRYMTTFESDQVFAELYYTARLIKQVMGVTPTCWRPPYGDVDDRVRAIAAGLGLRTILWEEDTNDWQIQPSGAKPTSVIDQNYQSIIGKAGSESPIVLTHEIVSATMKEFMKMYPKVKEAYKNVVPLTACQNITQPYPEDQLKYPNFKDFTGGNIAPSGLPDGQSMKVDPNAKFEPVALDQQAKNGYGYGDPKSGSGGGGDSSSSSSSGGSGSDSEEGSSAAAALSTSFASTAALFVAGAVAIAVI